MPLTTNLEEEEIVDSLGNVGNASMPEQGSRPNPWRKMVMTMMIIRLYKNKKKVIQVCYKSFNYDAVRYHSIFLYIPLMACWQAETSDLSFYNKIYLCLTDKLIGLLYLYIYILLIARCIFSFFLSFILFLVPSLFFYCLFPFSFIFCLPINAFLFLHSYIYVLILYGFVVKTTLCQKNPSFSSPL